MRHFVRKHFPSLFIYPDVYICVDKEFDDDVKKATKAGKKYLTALTNLQKKHNFNYDVNMIGFNAEAYIAWDLIKLQAQICEFEQNINGNSSESLKRRVYFDRQIHEILVVIAPLMCLILVVVKAIDMMKNSSLSNTTDESTPAHAHAIQSISMCGPKP